MLFVVLLGTVLCAVPAFAATPKPPLLVTRNGMVQATYTLHDVGGRLWNAVRDGVRAGKVMHVQRTISVVPRSSYFGIGGAGSASADLYVSYNLYQNTYAYGPDLKHMQTRHNENAVKAAVLNIKGLPLFTPDKLQTGAEYTINVSATVKDADRDTGWLRFVPLANLFRTSLNDSFDYIAR